MEYVNTWAAYTTLNMIFGELVLFDRAGTPLCLLHNNPLVSYQKPKLPWFGTAQIPHHLLSHLKTAHCFLLLQSQLLTATVLSSDLDICAVYESDMEHPEPSHPEAFRLWSETHPGQPLLISGIRILAADYSQGYLDLNLTYKNPPGPDYSQAFNPSFFASLLVAIRCYNDAVVELFRYGYPVVPVHIVDEISFLSVIHGTVGGLAVVEI
ncbi:MAG: hypothetical protein EOM10_00330 [Opitutae bacterium]|nr:hypothetical protein [Opitutae bacterium]